MSSTTTTTTIMMIKMIMTLIIFVHYNQNSSFATASVTRSAFIMPSLSSSSLSSSSSSSLRQQRQNVSLQSKQKDTNEEFKPNKPISLPSLENPPDAGPLYSTCRSVTGIEQQDDNNVEENDDTSSTTSNNNNDDDDNNSFVPNKPIELDSLKAQDMDRSFMGLQPRAYDTNRNAGINSDMNGYGGDDEEPLLMDTGLGVFTSSLILGGSIYFILAVFMDNGDGVDPLMIPLSF